MSGDLVAVGSPGTQPEGLTDEGTAWVWNSMSDKLDTILDPQPQAGAKFGFQVALTGTTLVVGAPGPGSGYGGAYVFDVSALPKQVFNVTDTIAPAANFGSSVAVGGSTIVVGAPNATADGLAHAGHAFTYIRKTGTLLTPLTSPRAIAGGMFGFSVADKGATIVVGAPNETAYGVSSAGNVYLYPEGSSAPSDVYVANWPVINSFGTSVAIGSGGKIAVGSVPAISNGYSGIAYVFTM